MRLCKTHEADEMMVHHVIIDEKTKRGRRRRKRKEKKQSKDGTVIEVFQTYESIPNSQKSLKRRKKDLLDG